MALFLATRDYDANNFHIEEVNPKFYKDVSINRIWEINNSNGMEAEVFVKEETLERAAIKAINLFAGV